MATIGRSIPYARPSTRDVATTTCGDVTVVTTRHLRLPRHAGAHYSTIVLTPTMRDVPACVRTVGLAAAMAAHADALRDAVACE